MNPCAGRAKKTGQTALAFILLVGNCLNPAGALQRDQHVVAKRLSAKFSK